MQRYVTAHLSEPSLLEKSDTDALRERSGSADLLADIAEVEERQSYLRAGYPSLPEAPEEGAGASQVSSRILQNGTVPAQTGGGARVEPLSAESFGVQFTFGREDHDHLVRAQELLSHEIPSGDLAAVFSLALKALLPRLEKRKFAATAKPRPGHRRSGADSRHIPDPVRRAVWERDQGCCTFVSEDGHRCGSRNSVEYDHIEAFARGGEATVENVRLLCRAHNRYEAERTFGPEFMRHKRIAAAEARAAAKAHAKQVREQEAAAARAKAAEEHAHELEVVPCLRTLGYNARESRDAAALCRDMRDAPIDQRVRVALTYFRLKCTKVPAEAGTRNPTGDGLRQLPAMNAPCSA